MCWVADENILLAHDGSAWGAVSSGGSPSLNPVPLVGVNAMADANNRLAVAAANTLFSHDGTDHRVKINKALAVDTASMVLQSGFDGHAEIGLTGDDDLHVKVSADGVSWVESLTVDRSSGAVDFPQGISAVAGGPLAGFRNYMINGGFTVWQRGEILGLNYVYKADRWLWFNTAGDGVGSISRSSDVPPGEGFESSLKLSLTALPSGDDGFRQFIDFGTYKILEGKKVTLSCWVKGPTGAAITADIRDVGGAVTGTNSWQKIVITTIIPSGFDGVAYPAAWVGLFRNLQTVGDYYATGFQLELGELATPYELKPQPLELALCRYYFQRHAVQQNVADLAYEMRATPTQSGAGPYDYDAEL